MLLVIKEFTEKGSDRTNFFFNSVLTKIGEVMFTFF